MNRAKHGEKLLEELDLLHQAHRPVSELGSKMGFPIKEAYRVQLREKTKTPPDSGDITGGSKNKRGPFCFKKWKGLRIFAGIRQPRLRCVVCLQVHQIRDLPLSMNGWYIVVNWRRGGWEGDQTLPVQVRGGIANFDDILLHCCDFRCDSKNFTIWVSSVDAKDCDLGTYEVGLAELAAGPTFQNSNSKFGGKTMSFNLCGIAVGGTLITSFYYRIIQAEFNQVQQNISEEHSGLKEENKCFPCLGDFKHKKNRPLIGSSRRVLSLESDLDFITIENSMANCCQIDDKEDFITIERELGKASSRMNSNNDSNPDEENESGSKEGIDEKNPSFFMSFDDEFELDFIEDEFLRMIEEKNLTTGSFGRSNSIGSYRKDGKEKVNLNLDLDSVMKAAEQELIKATQIWKSKAEARVLEKAECEELMKRWGLAETAFNLHSTSLDSSGGFGSPI